MTYTNPVAVQTHKLPSVVENYFVGELNFVSLEGKGNRQIADVSKKHNSEPSKTLATDLQGAGNKACFIYSDGKQNQTGFEFVSSKDFLNQLDASMKLQVAQTPTAGQKTTYGKNGANVQVVST